MAKKVNGWQGIPYALPQQAPVPPRTPSPWAGVPYALPEEMQSTPTQASVDQASTTNPTDAESLAQNFNRLKSTGFQAPSGPINRTENKLTDQEQLKNLSVENTYLSPEDYNKLVQAAALTEPVKERKQQLANLDQFNRETIDSLPAQTDLSPLAALVDQWTGSNLSRSYKRPMAAEERAKLLMDYGTKTEANRQKLLDEVMKAAQYMKSGTATNQLMSSLTGIQGAGYVQPKPTSSGSGARMDWNIVQAGDKINKDFLAANSTLDQLQTAIQGGKLADVQQALSLAARAISGEKGVLTDQDIGRVLPQTIGMTADKFQAWLTNNPGVVMNPKILQTLRDQIPVIRARLQATKQAQLGTIQQAMKNSPELAGKANLLDPTRSTIAAPPGAKQEMGIKDMFKELLKQNAGKK